MMPEPEPPLREIDDTLAPLVFVYMFVIVAAMIAVLAWVFWFRGYA